MHGRVRRRCRPAPPGPAPHLVLVEPALELMVVVAPVLALLVQVGAQLVGAAAQALDLRTRTRTSPIRQAYLSRHVHDVS